MLKIVITLPVFLFLFSCASNPNQVNDNFIRQYGSEVKRINRERSVVENESKVPSYIKSKKTYGWNDPAIIIGVGGSYRYKSAYIDTSQLKLKPQAEDFLPNIKTFMDNQNYRRLPENMFEIKYLAVNYPDSYGKPSVSFDDIKIPDRDAYGVETSLGEKNYTLINGRVLQRNVDDINNSTSYDDREVRMILVKEQKELDRKRRLGILKSKDEIQKNNQSKSESTIN